MIIQLLRDFIHLIVPVRKGERRFFLYTLSLITCINVNFYILKSSKSALIVTAPEAGAEVIPYLQFWGIMPAVIVMTWALSRLMRSFEIKHAFMITTAAFIGALCLFSFWMYPNHKTLHNLEIVNVLSNGIAPYCTGLACLIKHWTFTLYYIVSELWKIAIFMLFWAYLNRNFVLADAKRLYAPLMFGSCVGAMLAGPITVFCSSEISHSLFPLSSDAWAHSLQLLTWVIALCGVVIGIMFYLITQRVSVMTKVEHTPEKDSAFKKNLSLGSSLRYLLRSPYLTCLAMIIVTDYIAYSLGELVFFHYVKVLYPNTQDYCSFMGEVTFWTGFLTGVSALFITPIMVQKCNWRVVALASPLVYLAVSVLFFILAIFQDTTWVNALSYQMFDVNAVSLVVIVGAAQYAIGRAAKYTMLDTAKELALIPLDPEGQVRGKLIIDGLAARFGRASSSLISMGLIAAFQNISATLPYAGISMLGFTFAWLKATLQASREYDKLEKTV